MELASLVPYSNIAQPGPLTVPRELRPQIRQRNILVSEIGDGGATDCFYLRMFAGKIHRPGQFESDWRVKCRVREQVARAGGIEQRFEINTAARLKSPVIALSASGRGCDKITEMICPLTLGEVKDLIAPFRSG